MVRQQRKPKRHCMVVHAYYPLGESRVERQAGALLAQGYDVDILCLRDAGEPAFEELDGSRIYRLPVRRHKGHRPAVQLLEYLAFFLLASLKLLVLHGRQRYATVQVHNLPDFLIFCALVPRLTGARLLLDLHDLMPEFFASSFKRGMDHWAVRLLIWQERLSCRFAHQVITVTESWRETLIGRGVPSHKVAVVMNVADDRVFRPEGTAGQPPNDPHCFRLIYHGTLAQRYGVDLLLRAVAAARQEIPGLHLTIHGNGEFYQELVRLADELSLEACVAFSTQLLPIAELPRLIQQADVGIVPNRRDLFTDGILPTKLMEYAALQMPVIAARTPAVAAYFDESMVELFTPGDPAALTQAILRLYQDPARRAHLARNIERFNQAYNWTQVAATYCALVEQVGPVVQARPSSLPST